MATYVLVHGAWHGGWCWRKLVPLLEAEGHAVYTPTLTGLGDRSHLGGPQVNLTMHIQDVVNVLVFEDLSDVILVGHSYAGMVISGVAGQLPERLAHLVYLDAFVPGPEESFHDQLPPEAARRQLESAVHGWRVPPLPGFFGVTDAVDQAWLASHLTPHPLGTLTEPLDYGPPLENQPFGRTYVWASGGGMASTFASIFDRLRSNPAWRVREVVTGHDVMVTEPRQLADLLLELA